MADISGFEIFLVLAAIVGIMATIMFFFLSSCHGCMMKES
jgi:UPF0716 family protein affecting phage T7 exclusion